MKQRIKIKQAKKELNKAMDFAFDSDTSSSSKILIKDKNTGVTGT